MDKHIHTQTETGQNALPVESTKRDYGSSLGIIFVGAAAITFDVAVLKHVNGAAHNKHVSNSRADAETKE
ncbi:hypothetical protein JCM10295v2_005605 [Rhodotorula toruloides]